MIYSNERTGIRIMRSMLALNARSSHDTLVSVAKDALGIEGQHTMCSVNSKKQSMQ